MGGIRLLELSQFDISSFYQFKAQNHYKLNFLYDIVPSMENNYQIFGMMFAYFGTSFI